MNEKIYCWGQVNEELRSKDPVQVQMPVGWLSVSLARAASYVWTESQVYSWGKTFDLLPHQCHTSPHKINSVTPGVSGPLVADESEATSEQVTQVASNFSGFITLDKAQVVRSSCKTSILTSVQQVASDVSSFYALDANGTVYKWAHIHSPVSLEISERIIEISAGSQHSVFKTENSEIYVIGSNSYGQISLPSVSEVQVPVKLSGLKAWKVACGGFHSLLLSLEGKVFTCGLGTMGQLISGSFVNCESFTERDLPAGLGEVSDVYCAELTSFVRFEKKADETRQGPGSQPSSLLKFLHRQLVASAERSFLDKVKEEVKAQKLIDLKRSQREKKAQEVLVLFESEILPNWKNYKGSKVLADLVKHGLPGKYRGDVWSLLQSSRMKVKRQEYEVLIEDLKELKNKNDFNDEQGAIFTSFKLISLDIFRTFNNLGYFCHGSPLSKDLQLLLELACLYKPETGYIQGMSYVAGMLLLNLDTFRAFSVFISIISGPVLLPFFKIDQEGIQRRTEIFLQILIENLPEIHSKFEDEGLQLPIVLMEWFVTLYSRTLNQEVSIRVWDLFFLFGEIVLFKVGIAIMRVLVKEILGLEMGEVMTCFSNLAEKVKDPDEFIAEVLNVKVSESVINVINGL